MSTDMKKDGDVEAQSPAEKETEGVFIDEKFTEDIEDSSTEEDVDDYDISKSDRDALIRALSQQAYHLPGNTTWWQDWRQYFGNNHPLLGICFHHPLHPIPWYMRVLHLVSSVVFGLALTNLVWIWFVLDDNLSEDQVLVNVDLGISSNITQLSTYIEQLNEENEVEVTTGMVFLWTVGATVHSFYDNIIWHLTLCACCLEGRRFHWAAKYKNVGVGLLSLGIIVLLAATSLFVVIRSSVEQEENKAMLKQEFQQIDWQSAALKDWNNNENLYEFLLGYSIELALSLFVYFFIVGTFIFAGVFGCSGRYPMLGPFLGGRPYELKQLEKQSGEGVEVVLDKEGHEDIQSGPFT